MESGCQRNYAGIVTKTNKNRVLVKIEKPTACGSCRACAMFVSNKNVFIPVINTVGATVGDEVEITSPQIKPLFATLMLLIFPLVLLICGLLIGSNFSFGELCTALTAIGFMTVGFLTALIVDRTILNVKYLSQTVKIIENTHIGEEK